MANGVTDFAHGGVELNKHSNCFDGCLATGAVTQNFKVALMDSSSPYKVRDVDAKAKGSASLTNAKDDDDDPNATSCVDPQLRKEIRRVLGGAVSCKVGSTSSVRMKTKLSLSTPHHYQKVVDTLLSNLNRPGWAVNCVAFEDSGLDIYYQDMNFCDYTTSWQSYVFDIRLAKIDNT
ncbi:hypothetical protein ANCCEY_06848 [Ancylostoma ceylanicum]|uniref:Uncharacterized protein n=1 Tax=Ancylostoma ceylanicum TaxID=53326 RepID=A0A0D6LVE9_9BILA|nr:hypothetical protein ANCCEY_06848 [Ancylostoma ceylanicum]